jgi:uncharacterized protein (TIGR03437 family)
LFFWRDVPHVTFLEQINKSTSQNALCAPSVEVSLESQIDMLSRVFLSLAIVCASLNAQVAIVSSASFRANQPVAAGSYATAFGTFTGVPTTTSTAATLPTTLGGVTLKIEGVSAPLYDVRASQVSFLVPASLAPGLHSVQVNLPAGTVSGSVRVVSAAPGLFTLSAQTPPQGAIINQDGVTINASSAPAKRGDVVSVYGTGPGAFKQPVTDGALPGASPLNGTVSTPQVFVGGVEAEVKYSGLNPSIAGLWQLNFVVPNLAFVTGRVPVVVFMDGVDSNEVTVFVQ